MIISQFGQPFDGILQQKFRLMLFTGGDSFGACLSKLRHNLSRTPIKNFQQAFAEYPEFSLER